MRFPKLVRNPQTDVLVVVTDEPNEFGERKELLNDSFKCNYQDSAKVHYTSEKQAVRITGTIYIDGDILPGYSVIASGHVVIFGEKREIVTGTKARNLDGSVNYTRLDVR